MSDQLLSTEPAAGLLSTDPAAATPAPVTPGYWQDLPGFQGKAWIPPGGPRDLTRRADTSMLSSDLVNVDAEDVLIGGQVVRGIRGAMATATGSAGRATAGLRAMLGIAKPIVKYEITKNLLEAMHVPASVAIPIAIAVSGGPHGEATAPRAPGTRAGRGPAPPPIPTEPVPGTKPRVPASQTPADELRTRILGPPPQGGYVDAPAAPSGPIAPPAGPPVAPPAARVPGPASAPAPAAPAAASPVARVPPAAPAPAPAAPTPPAGPNWSPQRLANEVGLAARRAKLTLTDAQYAEAEALVLKGQSPASAVRAVAPAPTLKLTDLTTAEMRAYTAARKDGVPHDEAMKLVAATRELVTRLGTPSPAAVREAVAERNATGRWPRE